jgi:hypothetical protein
MKLKKTEMINKKERFCPIAPEGSLSRTINEKVPFKGFRG